MKLWSFLSLNESSLCNSFYTQTQESKFANKTLSFVRRSMFTEL